MTQPLEESVHSATASSGAETPKAWPKISIVTPSFNQGAFLEETMHSVLSQGYPNLEYIVVDGGSTDHSVQIIRKHAAQLAWWVSEKDRGQTHAINKGFAHATGDIYGFINSDDLLEPGILRATAECYIAGHRWISSSIRLFGESLQESIWTARPERCEEEWLYDCMIPQQATFWAGELYRELGPFREDLHCVFDLEYWLRLRYVAKVRPHTTGRIGAAFRFHPDSKSMNLLERFDIEERRVRREYRKLLPLGPRLRAWYRERRLLGNRRQIAALRYAEARDRMRGLEGVAASVWFWPPLALQRRTAGAIKRVLLGHAPPEKVASRCGRQPGQLQEEVASGAK